jgi:hypothetical protein
MVFVNDILILQGAKSARVFILYQHSFTPPCTSGTLLKAYRMFHNCDPALIASRIPAVVVYRSCRICDVVPALWIV